MTHASPTSSHLRHALCALAMFAALAAGCGGGSDSGVGGGGTGSPLSFSQGPITGFGSIIVNGVHFDDTPATVVDDDGNSLANTQALRLGTVVDVQGGVISNDAATASAIHVHVDLVGPVTAAYDATAGQLAVLGQPVRVLSTTALDGFSGGAAAIAVGSTVAVSSLYDSATGVYVATRIDPAPNAPRFAIRGAPSAIDAMADTFTIGGVVFSYGNVAPPSPFAIGDLLRAVLAPAKDSHGRWVVTAFGQARPTLPDGRRGGVQGVVSSAADATHFVVNGVTVDASQATVTPTGAAIGVQARVEVRGTVAAGILVATSVHLDARNDGDDDDDNGNGNTGGSGDLGRFEIDGPVLTLDTGHQALTMRGPTTVSYATAAFAGGGKVSDLAVGKQIEVRGNLSADGSQVIATQIKFGH